MGKITCEIWPSDAPEAIKIEYDVFVKAKYIEPNSHKKVLEYDRYPFARFLVALDKDKIAGVVRLIVDKNNSVRQLNLPTLNDFEIWPSAYKILEKFPPLKIVEIGTMSIPKAYRGGFVRKFLTKKIIIESLTSGMQCAVASIDEKFYKAMLRMKFGFTQIGTEKHYLGSVTVPVLYSIYDLPFSYRALAYFIMIIRKLLGK